MTFAEELATLPFSERDAWVDERLGIEAPPPDIALPSGAVPYLPCGVEEISAAFDALRLGPQDLFVDIGSGLGRVVFLAHLLTGARAHGVELQAHLVEASRRKARALGLDRAVTFTHANAADLELDGTCFFLYAPCNGELLSRVVKRLDALAQRRPVKVCTVDLELTGMRALRPRTAMSPLVNLYASS